VDLKPFRSISRGDSSVKRFLAKACWKNQARFCILFKTRKIYGVRRDRYRCSRCGYEFSDFTGRWINKVKLPLRNWLWLIKLFELEISARKASHQLGISYPTAHKAFHLIRQSITTHSRSGESLLDGGVETEENYFEKGRRGYGVERSKTAFPVFGVLERRGLVRVEPLQNFSAEAILNLTVKTARTGSIVYTDRWGSYDALIFCGSKRFTVDSGRRLSQSDIPRNNGMEGFWSYTKERMNKFHGVSGEKFPFYLKEMEFRYNHRHRSIFNTLVQYLCDLTAI